MAKFTQKYIRNRFEKIIGALWDDADASSSHTDKDLSEYGLNLLRDPDQRRAGILLRRAGASDSLFIGRLSRDVFSVYGPYEDILLRWFKSEKGVETILACQDNVRIGFAMLGEPCLRYDLEDASEILGIAVEPEKQGTGVGRMLLEALDAVSADFGIKWLLLHTATENTPARRLYEKIGYRILEFKKNFYPEGQDAVVMYKEVRTI
jgi:ribosomal protein S18 acetylase RimI-like enzyme